MLFVKGNPSNGDLISFIDVWISDILDVHPQQSCHCYLFEGEGQESHDEKTLKVISSEFSCDGKREFSMGCECGRRNVTEEIERHCQASARIEGGGKCNEKSII